MMVKSLLIFFLLIIPHTVFAGCILIDTPYKFEGVCSGYNPMSPPTDSKKKHKKKTVGRVRKVDLENSDSVMQIIGMSEEESKFMKSRNQMDGYRGKRKTKVQIAQK
jgi:hypothetical protein